MIGDGISGWEVVASDNYAKLSSTPITGGEFHLPVITSDKANKKIHVTTYA